MKNMLCIIPARGGSKRIPRKNILNFMGKPMIAYSIGAIQNANIADEIMVSTDDDEIKEIALQCGAKVPFMRSGDAANDSAGLVDVMIEVINKYGKLGLNFEYVMCVLATAPLINYQDLINAYQILRNSGNAESICSVEAFSYPPQRGLVIENGLLKMKNPENYYARSQDLEKIYHDCGQFFIYKTEALLRDGKMYTENMLPYEINEMDSQDIDDLEDLKLAEIKYRIKYGGLGEHAGRK
jgi:N-acylneuraminate cytidylyltransferase